MAEQIRPDLLSFLMPNTAPLRILVVESLTYLSELRRMFPQAELYAVTSEADAMEMDASAGVHWQILDYLSVPLPYIRGYFDYIISDLTLEQADNPQDIAAGFSMFLKETGAFLTSFRNIRHWSILKNLRTSSMHPFTKVFVYIGRSERRRRNCLIVSSLPGLRMSLMILRQSSILYVRIARCRSCHSSNRCIRRLRVSRWCA